MDWYKISLNLIIKDITSGNLMHTLKINGLIKVNWAGF